MSENRLKLIKTVLTENFSPLNLEIIDESDAHIGHAGAKSGKGHFKISIISKDFLGKTLIQRQKLVYNALKNLMETDIHALSMSTLAPGEEK